MDDLERVGFDKILGYLPLDTIRGLGFDPYESEMHYRKRGLYTKILLDGQCHVGSGALYVADFAKLSRLLSINQDALIQERWPVDVTGFVDRVAIENVSRDSQIFQIIREAFEVGYV